MKRIFALLLLMCLLLTACSNGQTNGNESSSESSSAESTSEESSSAEDTIDPALIGESGLLKDSTVLFNGDSIVDCYRGNYSDPTLLGRDYNFVSAINRYLQTNFASDNITVYNTGIGGWRIQDMQKRAKGYIYDLKPDYVVILLGTNNAWNDTYTIDESIEDYEKMLTDIVKKTGAKLFVMTPYLLESTGQLYGGPLNRFIEPMDEIRDKMCKMIAELDDTMDITVIHTQAIFEQLIANYGKTYQELTIDFIHPSEYCYGVITQVVAQAMGIKDFPMDYEFDFSAIDAKYGLNGVEKTS